ncbi:50S ribosomal protein L6 [Ehrlichia ruminantium]|uniref:50S ribosomal protein L6 n=1 Tax=Ehrlichia ruminantium (strain Welgevonden) TaxID=254945 RepID=A0A0H3M097_EHRRW|nr:50S ribosomal protein L6 [Ehrlichia ruminantium]QLK52521.1 50S ribosomal protein L6 [Ehrlichia ruminantium]QLK54351.1 50S ribosomal protein L6 [Ehrlichia ruminantium]QLK55272.1 50S ribosomal protein L6 [Ehrlichia ruminantium]QLK56188.1 50S ribosomal protein L6 [Ehrlichia ruminantium]QLK57103.1 50S ribosomal protein L6 [Ehrlichia ruminantium]
MSRVGSMPILIPSNVQVDLVGNQLTLKNSENSLKLVLDYGISCNIDGNSITLHVNDSSANSKVMWGTYRSMINSYAIGLSQGLVVELEITGVGYKAEVNDEYLSLSLGFSHGIKYKIPNGIIIQCVKPTQILVKGFDKQKVYMVASDICSIRKYNPYKGKGISIKGKYIYRKEVNKKK